MSNPITDSQYVRLLDKRLKSVSDKVGNQLKPMTSEFFNIMPSDKAWEEFYSVTGLGDIQPFTGELQYVTSYPGFWVKVEPKEFYSGVVIERRFMDDNQYPVLDNFATMLREAEIRTKDKYSARIWNYAFSNTFDFMTSEEALSMCNDSHTNKSGTSTSSGFDNAGTSAASKTAVAATWLLMRRFRDNISERIEINPDLIICPDALGDTFEEVVGSEKDPTSANNAINPNYKRVRVLRCKRLDDYSTKNWFMVDSSMMKKNQIWIDKVSAEVNNWTDQKTLQFVHAIYSRWGYCFTDWRHVYGHSVT